MLPPSMPAMSRGDAMSVRSRSLMSRPARRWCTNITFAFVVKAFHPDERILTEDGWISLSAR